MAGAEESLAEVLCDPLAMSDPAGRFLTSREEPEACPS
jgi:hypothetical protein